MVRWVVRRRIMSTRDTGGSRGRAPDVDLTDELGSETEASPGSPALTDDEMFEVLSNRRRRRVIEYLRTGDGTASAGELAVQIASAENDTPVQEVSSYERKRVYVSLYQNHLPVMDDAGVIDYDADRKTVRLLPTVAKCEPYLEARVRNHHSRVLVALALLIAAIVLVGSLQIGPLASLPITAWVAFGIAGLVGVAGLELHGVRGG